MNPPTTKPTSDTLHRVYRGGSWCSGPSLVRAARSAVVPAFRYSIIGFRCALRGCERKVKP